MQHLHDMMQPATALPEPVPDDGKVQQGWSHVVWESCVGACKWHSQLRYALQSLQSSPSMMTVAKLRTC